MGWEKYPRKEGRVQAKESQVLLSLDSSALLAGGAEMGELSMFRNNNIVYPGFLFSLSGRNHHAGGLTDTSP